MFAEGANKSTIVKPNIHPEWVEAKVTCACGETFTSYSTKKVLKVEICSKCHPLFTGQQKILDSEGRVEKFMSKYAKKKEPAAPKSAAAAAPAPAPKSKKKTAAAE